jgi:hypothetical protein
VVVGGLLRRAVLREDARRLRQRFGALVKDRVMPIVDGMAMEYENAIKMWEAGEYRAEGASLQQQAARALAASAHPRSRTQLASVTLPDGTDTERRRLVRDLARVLEGIPAFSPVSRRSWELGRAGVDFGVFGDSAPALLQSDPLAKSRHLRAAVEARQRVHEIED